MLRCFCYDFYSSRSDRISMRFPFERSSKACNFLWGKFYVVSPSFYGIYRVIAVGLSPSWLELSIVSLVLCINSTFPAFTWIRQSQPSVGKISPNFSAFLCHPDTVPHNLVGIILNLIQNYLF